MRLTVSLLAALAVALLATCGRDSRQEVTEGKALVALLRRLSPEIEDLNLTEYEYVQASKALLFTARDLLPANQVTLTDEVFASNQLPRLRELLDHTAIGRKKIRKEISDLHLTMPLPLAIQTDLTERLEERIEASDRWRVQVYVLAAAQSTKDVATIRREITQLLELFEAYGPLQNPLKKAADDLEEQLRLRW